MQTREAQGQKSFSRPTVRRIATVLPLGALVGALSITSSIANVTSKRAPEIALRVAPYSASARAGVAERLLKPGIAKADRERAEALALGALERTPLSPVGARVLAFLSDIQRDTARSRSQIHVAAALSKRDFPTRLWLIEEAVRRNDAAGALEQYDLALKTSRNARRALYPVLANALSDDSYVVPISQLFARRPEWLGEFSVVTLQQGGATANLARALEDVPDLNDFGVPNLEQLVVTQLVAEQRFAAAQRFAVARSGGASGRPLLIAPDFSARAIAAPFAWDLISQTGLGAERGNSGIEVYANVAESGPVASQLLTLPAGDYVLRSVGTARATDPDGGAQWTITCARQDGAILAQLNLPRQKMGAVGTRFRVPARSCDGQWLRLTIVPTDSPRGVAGTIRRVDITRSS